MKLTPEDQKRLQEKELANIIRKLNGGKTLTAREEAKLAAASNPVAPAEADPYVGTWDELGRRLQPPVTRRAIQGWRSDPRYMPEIEKRRHLLERQDGRHCVAEWQRLMVDLHLKRGAAAADAQDGPQNAGEDEEGLINPPSYGGKQSDWVKAKIAKEVERKAIDIDTVKGTLLEAPELEIPIGATFATIQAKLAQFPQRVARYLVGLRDEAEIEDRLRDEIDADLSDLNGAGYTAEDAVYAAVNALPFDEHSEHLFTAVCFAGQDRAALLQLIAAVATQALRQLGRRAIAKALHEADVLDTALADPLTGQVTDEASDREAFARAAPSHSRSPAADSDPAKRPELAVPSRSVAKGRKKKARPKPTPAPAEMEASIAKATRRRRK